LLLKAAAKLQPVLETWDQKPPSSLPGALPVTPERAEFGHVRDG
jgi:hypothetical protein